MGWGSSSFLHGERGPGKGGKQARQQTAALAKLGSGGPAYHIPAWRKPWPSFLVDGHLCVLRSCRRRGGAGVRLGAILHVQQELVFVVGRGERDGFGGRSRLEERCWRRHRDGYGCVLLRAILEDVARVSTSVIVDRVSHRLFRLVTLGDFGGGGTVLFEKSWTRCTIWSLSIGSHPPPARPRQGRRRADPLGTVLASWARQAFQGPERAWFPSPKPSDLKHPTKPTTNKHPRPWLERRSKRGPCAPACLSTMTSSATATQLGRHIWSSIRDPTNVHLTRLPARRSLSTGIRTGQLLSRPSHSQNDRSFHNATCFFRPCPFPYFRSPRQGSPPKGRLLIGHTSSSTAQSAVTTSTTAASSALVGSAGQRALLSHVARQIWRQGVESNSQRGLSPAPGRRANSSSTRGDGGKQKALLQEQAESQHQGLRKKTPVPDASDSESLANSMSKYLHLPKMPHRPTKEELLAAASGFRERLKVRFKWFSIRSMRPWNADEWGAFVSWFLFGHLVWILVGTTTFFSLVILTINTVFAQGRQRLPYYLELNKLTGSRNSCKVDRRLSHAIGRPDRGL